MFIDFFQFLSKNRPGKGQTYQNTNTEISYKHHATTPCNISFPDTDGDLWISLEKLRVGESVILWVPRDWLNMDKAIVIKRYILLPDFSRGGCMHGGGCFLFLLFKLFINQIELVTTLFLRLKFEASFLLILGDWLGFQMSRIVSARVKHSRHYLSVSGLNPTLSKFNNAFLEVEQTSNVSLHFFWSNV